MTEAPDKYLYQYPPMINYIPSVMMFGIGAVFHAALIYKRPQTLMQPFGIGWGTVAAMLIAPKEHRIEIIQGMTDSVQQNDQHN